MNLCCIRWTRTGENRRLAAGSKTGDLVVVDLTTRDVFQLPRFQEKEAAVLDLQWDPLSNNYLTVAYAGGGMALYDFEARSVAVTFEDSSEMAMMSWIPNIPGGFITVSSRAPTLKVWNVSRSTPVDVIKISNKSTGCHAIKPVPNSTRYMILFKDGSVGIFDLGKKRLVYCTVPGHSETVFDCRFKPTDPNILATSSYDGTVKLWDVRQMKCVQELAGQQGVLYSISWAPSGADEDRLVSASSRGEIFMWNTKTGQILKRFQHHNESIFRVCWCPQDPDLLISTSSDKNLIVFNSSGTVLRKYGHPAQVYGCDINPFNKDLIATGCHDGMVRVFDLSQQTSMARQELRGHRARVFHTVWSPLLPNYLCSGSDDRTIIVWNIKTNEHTVLTGHTNNVRALLWHPELPYLLLSGSWDGTIRLWDIRTSTCLSVLSDHHADVYGLAMHPLRPFVFVSSSRDTSVRFWNIDEHRIAALRMKCILAGGLPAEVLGTTDDVMRKDEARLCSDASKALALELKQIESPLQKFAKIFDYFTFSVGLSEMWKLASCVSQEGVSEPNDLVVHVKDMALLARNRALQLLNVRASFQMGSPLERIRAAADIYLKNGHLREYCELLVQLEEWDKALAVAPGVSIQYWMSLSQRRAAQLTAEGDDAAVPHLIATHDIRKSVDFYSSVGDYASALQVARAYRHIDVDESKGEGEQKQEPEMKSNLLLDQVCQEYAESEFDKGHPPLAAALHLALSNSYSAVQKLVRGNEVELAYALATALKLRFVDHVLKELALRCEKLGLWEEAVQLLRRTKNADMDATLVCARFPAPTTPLIDDFYRRVGLSSVAGYAEEASGARSQERKLVCLLLARQTEQAVVLALSMIKNIMRGKAWREADALNIVNMVSAVPLTFLDAPLREEFLAYAYYLGGLQAIHRGYVSIIRHLFHAARLCIGRNNLEFPVSSYIMRLQEMAAYAQHTPSYAAPGLASLLAEPDLDVDLQNSIQSHYEFLNHHSHIECEGVTTNVIKPSSSDLPSASRKSLRSCLDLQPICGPGYVLEDNASHMSRGDALMWYQVCAYSPLVTGSRMYPF
eukprot:TRINITY_DN4691_c0_g1_i4.p1 TRINITY_DN4691_c0_g1~~TRINITY_DN4691_c0_g1_i4.p1  ORF type:complete len:1101 (-),score=371.19 TRINITY_DN4691_c0_g1_i4:99-3326(-)